MKSLVGGHRTTRVAPRWGLRRLLSVRLLSARSPQRCILHRLPRMKSPNRSLPESASPDTSSVDFARSTENSRTLSLNSFFSSLLCLSYRSNHVRPCGRQENLLPCFSSLSF